jgi:hypothetical protein
VWLLVSALVPLHTEEEWEEVRQRISNQPHDEALSEEFYKVKALPSSMY